MDRIENGMYGTKSMYTAIHKSFPIQYGLWGKFLKRILTYLYCSKHNEIKICHSDVQKCVSFIGSHERFLIHYALCFETSENVFPIVMNSF